MPEITRRKFSTALAGSLVARAAESVRPNILWITCEDIGPDLHACGKEYSVTPHLDALSDQSLLYVEAWSNAPVCAPARTTIISGLYPPSTGSEHMRSTVNLPDSFKMFPQYLREAGYYCSNNVKEDYNLTKPGQVWDDSSKDAHWRKRSAGQPFFSVFNFTITHESQIRKRPHRFVHDPAKAPLPAFHPDAPEVRQDWAQYYDNITTMDGQAGELMEELKSDGLLEDTIVFFYGDHGSGMPGYKRCARNTGLNVCILLHVPDKFRALAPPEYRAGTKSSRMVGFIDLAPTVLSLAGVEPPAHFQGEAFAGKHQKKERDYNFGFRGRMDERYDLVRTARDKQYVYVRNYMPHKPMGQHVAYMFQTPATRAWKALYDAGKLNRVQSQFWERRPAEELYDLSSDRDEVRNLAASAEHRDTLNRFRKAQQQWTKKICDVGFLPEGEIHSRSKGSSPYELGHSPDRYPMEQVIRQAEIASSLSPKEIAALAAGLKHADSAVRYWSALGFVMRGKEAVEPHRAALRQALEDGSPYVRITAAEALGRFSDDPSDTGKVLDLLLALAPSGTNEHYTALLALNALDALGRRARSHIETIRGIAVTDDRVRKTEAENCKAVRDAIVANLS